MRSGRGIWRGPGGPVCVKTPARGVAISRAAIGRLEHGDTATSGGGTFPAGGISSSWPQTWLPVVIDGLSSCGVP